MTCRKKESTAKSSEDTVPSRDRIIHQGNAWSEM